MKEECTRNFNRYACESDCEVKIDSEVYNGKAFSFSDGVGVIIENAPHLEKGTRADIKIIEYEIEFKAEVAWTKKEDNHIRAGFKRLGNFRGNLKHYRLPDIFIGISRGKKTGVLEITSGTTVKKIFIKNGDKLFAASNNKDDRLGEYLLKQGKISLEEFNQASYLVIKTGQRLGKVLVDLGYLKANELYREVQNQIEEIIVSLFLLEEGEFEFKEGPLSKDESITLQISSANLIYRGIKKINNFVHVKKMCPSVDNVFNLSANTMNIFKTLTLEEHDKKILSLINGVNSLKTILALSPATNFSTLKTICTLISIGLISMKGEGDKPQRLPITRIFGDPDEEVMVKFRETIPEVKAVMNKRGEIRDERGDGESEKVSEEKIIIIGDDEPVEEDIHAVGKAHKDNMEHHDTDQTKNINLDTPEEDKENSETIVESSCSTDFSEEVSLAKETGATETAVEETESTGQPVEKAGMDIPCTPEEDIVMYESGDAETTACEKAEAGEVPEIENRDEISYSPIDGTVAESSGEKEETVYETTEAESQDEEKVIAQISYSPEEGADIEVAGGTEETLSETAEAEEQAKENVSSRILYSPIDGTAIEEKQDLDVSMNEMTESAALPDETAVEEEKHEHEEGSVYRDDNAVEEIPEDTYGLVEKSEMNGMHPAGRPEAEAVMDSPDVLKDAFKKQLPVEVPKESVAASGTGGEVYFTDGSMEETDGNFNENTARKDDRASEEVAGKDEINMVREIADNVVASQKSHHGRKCLYVYGLLFLFVLSAAAATLIYYDINVFENIKTVFSQPAGSSDTAGSEMVEKPDTPVRPQAKKLPPLHDEIQEKAPFEKSEKTIPFPAFREDAIKKLLNEHTERSSKGSG